MNFNYQCRGTVVDLRQLFLSAESPCGVVGFLTDGTAIVPHNSRDEVELLEALSFLGAECCPCFSLLHQIRRDFERRIRRSIDPIFTLFRDPVVWDSVDRSARRFWDIWFPGSVPKFKALLKDIFFGSRRASQFRDGFVYEACRMLESLTESAWRVQPPMDSFDLCNNPVIYTSSPGWRPLQVSFSLPDLARSPCEKTFYVLWRREFAVVAAEACYFRGCRFRPTT